MPKEDRYSNNDRRREYHSHKLEERLLPIDSSDKTRLRISMKANPLGVMWTSFIEFTLNPLDLRFEFLSEVAIVVTVLLAEPLQFSLQFVNRRHLILVGKCQNDELP